MRTPTRIALATLAFLLGACDGPTVVLHGEPEEFQPFPWQVEVYERTLECLGVRSNLERVRWFHVDAISDGAYGAAWKAPHELYFHRWTEAGRVYRTDLNAYTVSHEAGHDGLQLGNDAHGREDFMSCTTLVPEEVT